MLCLLASETSVFAAATVLGANLLSRRRRSMSRITTEDGTDIDHKDHKAQQQRTLSVRGI
jgi:hypothetical protein